MARILVVEDEPMLRHLLGDALMAWGHEVKSAQTGAQAVAALQTELFDAALIDAGVPDMPGLDLLREVKRQDSATEVVMMTGPPAGSSAIEALKEGAFDYLSKPLILDELRHLLGGILERRFLRDEVSSLRARLGEALPLHELIGNSPSMREAREFIARVASSASAVLIEGERGTGKELVAAAIHRLSPRASRPFIPVNCSAIPDALLGSQLFGHEGTLFLDEVAALPPPGQTKLLEALSEMESRAVGASERIPVNLRIIAATTRDLEAATAQGAFRKDLYQGLAAVRTRLVPLRERVEDVPALVLHFIRRFNAKLGRNVHGIAPAALAMLGTYHFPGNVRELENVIERAFAVGAREQIAVADLPVLNRWAEGVLPDAASVPRLEDVERELIIKALAAFDHDKEAAADALGISRRTIYRRLKEYGLLGGAARGRLP